MAAMAAPFTRQFSLPSPSPALNIPEIVDLIFSFSENCDCARSARVNQCWFYAAIDHIWAYPKDLDTLSQLVENLLQYGESKPVQSVQSNLTMSNMSWNRFYFYSKRIRRISSTYSHRGNVNAFYFTADEAPASLRPLFPNLRHLEIDGPFLSPDVIRTMISQSISTLVFRFPDAGYGGDDGLCAAAMTVFEEIEIVILYDFGLAQKILDALMRMRELRKATLPSRLASPEVLSRLGTLPKLENIILGSP